MLDREKVISMADKSIKPTLDDYSNWRCGACGKRLIGKPEKCPWCGKKIDWEPPKEREE